MAPPPPSQAPPSPSVVARRARQPQLFIANKRPTANRPPIGLNHAATKQTQQAQPNLLPNLNSFSIPDSNDLLEATRRQVAADNASQGRPFWTIPAASKRTADDDMAFNFGQQASSAGASGSTPATSGANEGGSMFGPSKTTAGSLFGRDTNAPAPAFGSTPASNSGSTGGLFGSTNNTQSKPAGGFSFGQNTGSTPASGTATRSTQPPSLFGGNSGTTGGLFGGSNNNNNNNNNASANPFGSSTAGSSAPAPGSLFGAKPSASPAATPGEQPKAGGLFGSAAPGASSGGGLFGAAAASSQPSWSFGQNAPAADQNKPATTQSIFSSQAATGTPADKPLFGAITPQNNKTAPPSFTPAGNPPSSSLFGGKQKENEPASSQPQQGGSLFGAKPAATQAPSFQFPGTAPTQSSSTPQSNNGGLFAPKTNASGPNATTSTAPSLFGGAAQPQQSSSAAPASSAPAAGGLFSNLSQPGSSAPAQSAGQGLFSGASGFKLPGAPASSTTTQQPAATTTSAPAPTFSFPTAGQTTSSAPAQPASTAAPAPSFSFTQPTPSTTSQTPASAPAPAASSSGGLFGAAAPSPAASSAAPGGGLFSGAAPPAASNAGGSSVGLFGASTTSQAAPAASSGAPAGGLFSSTTPAAGQASTTAAPAASGLNATASTTGPAPPQQSRLASKTMDEILTMWSTSLATHQKTFQQLAQRVSTWDRQLVENSSKISALYGRCFQAERDCSEVERQLSNVEHGQLELEALLDRYEGEVDRMMEQSGWGEGAGAGGVDGERERTYKTAENCSTRLTEMHHSLTSMIEEVNASSSSLSAANGSSRSQQGSRDPLADIVTILNGHLSQLQAVDQGASALQGKVHQAQMEARGLSERNGLGSRGEWVEGFGRSYLGRR